MVRTLEKDPENEKFNRICRGHYSDYKGSRDCMYNMARAMSEAYDFLGKNVSHNFADWQWGKLHVNEYAHVPFSYTPLKALFHREVSIGGNANTVKVSKYSYKKFQTMGSFKSTHTPNFKMVVQYSDDPSEQKTLMSFDGG
jgi:acyl-homoserine lactone acylase PvdQ